MGIGRKEIQISKFKCQMNVKLRAHKAELAGHVPAKVQNQNFIIFELWI
jgi:hypothetical protein